MSKKDLLLAFSVGFLTAIFLLPTLSNTNLLSALPVSAYFVYAALFLVLPIGSVVGIIIAGVIGKKLAFLWQVAKFALVGVLNTAIDFGILNFLIAVTDVTGGLTIIGLKAASFSVAVVNSYFWNRDWVFPGSKRAHFVSFLIVTVIGISLNVGTVFFLTTYVSPVVVQSDVLWANVANVMATFISLTWNFIGYRLIVFKTSKAAAA